MAQGERGLAGGDMEARDSAEALVQRAIAALQGGNVDTALSCALAAAQATPDDAFAHEVLSLAYYRRGEVVPGVAAAEKAVMLEATAGRFANLGVLLRAVGRDRDAEDAYQHAIEIDAGFAAAHHNLGNLLLDKGDLGGAEARLRHAVSLWPDDAEAWRSLGTVLQRRGRFDEAIAALQEVLARVPGHPRALNDLGCCLMELERYDEGLTAFQQANALHPTYADTYGNIGALLLRMGCPFAAMMASEKALELDPGQHRWMRNLASALKDLGQFDAAEAMFRQILAQRPADAAAHGALLFCLNYHPDKTPEAIVAEYRRWDDAHARPLRPKDLVFDNDRDPERRLRVGLVSPDFREHSARHFLLPIMQGLDRERLEIVCYAEVARPDATTRQFMALADHWRSTVGLTDEALAELIRSDGTDILIDLGGHSASSRLMAFASKPAPVQVAHMLGCGYTSGLSAMDAFLADEALAPEGADALFVEPLMRLDRIPLAYSPPRDMPPVGPTPALAKGHVTFGYFGRPERINDRVVAAWSAILKGVPGARLMLNAKAFQEEAFQTLFREQFAAHGVGPERLEMVFTSPQPRTWAAYGEVDIALDPFPHNAGTTTIEALWLGVPVLSIKDRPSVGRFGASILGAVGLGDWVADDVGAYVSKAIAAAHDLEGLEALRASMRERFLASPLADAEGLGRSLSAGLRDLWRAWCAGGPDRNRAEAERLVMMAGQLRQAGRLAEADAAYGQALALAPDLAEAHVGRGLAWMRRGQASAAERDFRRALALSPDTPEIGFELAAALQDQGRLEEALAAHRAAVAARPDLAAGHSALLTCLSRQPHVPAEEVFAEVLRWGERHARPLTPADPVWSNDPSPGRCLRIGYVAPDFVARPTRHFIEPMLAGHDRKVVEVFVYADVAHSAAATAYFKTLADHWRPTGRLSDEDLAALIRHDRIDVVIDLGGHAPGGRLLALARRPAPVQIAHVLAQGHTSGMAAMDAILADERLAPEGCEALFAEPVARLPRIPIAYQAPPELPPVATLSALSGGHMTFGHFGDVANINERVIAAWARILNGVPGSRLMLKSAPFGDEAVRTRFRERFAAHGVTADRLELAGAMSQAAAWAAYGEVDIALDTFPHNMGLATVESLCLGAPVVSLAGRLSVSRLGLDILHAAGLDDWAAADVDAYVAKAVAAASDVAALAALRGGLRARAEASPLADGPGLARALEQACRALWRDWCADQRLDRAGLIAKADAALQCGDLAGAAARFDRLARAGDEAACWTKLGASLRGLGRSDQAEVAFRRAIDRDPGMADAHLSLAELLAGRGLYGDAEACYRVALDLAPDEAEPWRACAACLLALGEVAAARIAIDRTLALDRPAPKTLATLAAVLLAEGAAAASEHAYARALAASPDDPDALAGMAAAVQALGRFDEAEALFRRALAVRPAEVATHSALLRCLDQDPNCAAEAMLAEQLRWDEAHVRPLTPAHPAFANSKDPARRLRLGLVSPNFHDPAAGDGIEPLLAGIDRTEFELFCYAEAPRPGVVGGRLQALADQWRWSAGLSDAALAEQIQADGIDVLVDLGGHAPTSRLRVFARRPAPLQAALRLGDAAAVALACIDHNLDASEAGAKAMGASLAQSFRKLWRAWCGASEDDLASAAIAALDAGDNAWAADLADQALALDPGHFDALHVRGLAAMRQGHFAEAEASLRAAIAREPGRPEPQWSLVAVLHALGDLVGAEAVGREAIAAGPEAAEPHLHLGLVRRDLGDAAGAEAAFRAAIAFRPNHAGAWSQLAWALGRRGRPSEAEAAALKAIALGDDEAHDELAAALLQQERPVEAAEALRAVLDRRPGDAAAHSRLLVCLGHHPTLTAEAIFEDHRRWNAAHAAPLAQSTPPAFAFGDPARRLRVGYVAPDFQGQPLGALFEPVLAAHDHEAVELFCYAEGGGGVDHADHWRTTAGLNHEDFAQLVRSDRIDVLVDLAGHGVGGRLLAFARRCAPVQLAHVLGSGGATGLTEMDGVLADNTLAPVGSQVLFSEPLLRLPRIPWAYAPPEGMPGVARLPALTRRYVTFAGLGGHASLNEDVLDAWADILLHLPGARLMLNAEPLRDEPAREALQGRFQARGIGADRLDLAFAAAPAEARAALGRVDIALDPFPHNAAAAAVEALWLGVPVVSLADRPPMGRFGRAILGAAGMSDWAVDTLQAYVAKAVTAASDLPALATIRASLRQRVEASPLRDAAGLARVLEATYRQAWLAKAKG